MAITWLAFNIMALLINLGYLAYDDYTKKSIDNKQTALAWILMASALWLNGAINPAVVLALSFGTLFLINEIFYSHFKAPMVAWGDVIIVPLFLALASMLGIMTVFAYILAILLAFVTIKDWLKHKESIVKIKVPLVYYLYVPLVLAIVLTII